MTLSLKLYKDIFFIFIMFVSCFLGVSQAETSTFKAQLALGVNSPSASGFVSTFESKSINLPTVNLGLQYMFKPKLGAKLDFGFNRFSNLDNTRINVQLVYDASRLFGYLPLQIGIFPHVGPGFSFVKPLANYPENKTSFLNVMGGLELHYGISNSISLYVDTSYIAGFGNDFDPISTGFGSFNGNVLTVSFGISLSLSGCYYCERNE